VEKYETAKTTPMMAQWATIRQSLGEDPSTIVFCRVGDFYELFYDDAIIASKALDIQLTRRKIGKSTYPMAGVPHRSLENYVARLVNQGFKEKQLFSSNSHEKITTRTRIRTSCL
jgi:DNA mismatch repair protein MutS